MIRALPLAALLALSLAGGTAPVTVQPAWTLKNVNFRGFTDRGEVVTQPFSPGTGSLPELERRDPATGKVNATVTLPEEGKNLGLITFTRDLEAVAWLNRVGDVLTVRTRARRWTASTAGLSGTQSLVLSPDGRTLAAMNVNGYVQLWDVQKGERRATLLLHSQPRGIAFHPSLPLLAVNETAAEAGSVTLWDTNTGKQRLSVPGFKYTVRPFRFAPDGTLLVGRGFGVGLLDLGLERLNQGDWGVSVQTLPAYTEPCPRGVGLTTCARGIYGASFNADGSRVLLNFSRTAQNISSALLYDSTTGSLLKTFDTPGAGAVLTPDGKTLILSTFQGELQGAPLP